MKLIKKAVIPAAGLGTRFLPATKTIPKEMLPLVDKPTLLYNVEEAVAAGIEDIIIVAGRGKSAIEDFFDTSYEVEDLLHQQGKTEILESLKKISSMANIISIRQKEAKGLGHAVHCAKPIIGNESFTVLLGDEVTFPKDNYKHVTKELINLYEQNKKSCVNVMEVPNDQTFKYGVIQFNQTEFKHNGLGIMEVTDVIEKPAPGSAPSNFVLPGRYVFTAKIFEHLANTKPGKNGEVQLTDAMVSIAKSQGLQAINIPNRRYDAGDKLGYLIANIELALERDNLGPQLKKYLISLITRSY